MRECSDALRAKQEGFETQRRWPPRRAIAVADPDGGPGTGVLTRRTRNGGPDRHLALADPDWRTRTGGPGPGVLTGTSHSWAVRAGQICQSR